MHKNDFTSRHVMLDPFWEFYHYCDEIPPQVEFHQHPFYENISKYYLSKIFKQFTGMSVYQYIMKKRLTLSRNMLRAGVPVTTACMDCGFNDYSNYLKAFKREFGRNPSEYINSAL